MQPKLRFKEFETEWRKARLGSLVLKVGSGSTPKGGQTVYLTDGVPFFRSQNVNNNQLLLGDIVYISPKMDLKMKGSRVLPNDVLLNITGASIGRSCVVPRTVINGNVNQHVCIIRLKTFYSSHFIQAYLSSFSGQVQISRLQMGGGGRV